jgi:hypothetical protein
MEHSFSFFSPINYLCIQFKNKMGDGAVALIFELACYTIQGIFVFLEAKDKRSSTNKKKKSISELPSNKYPRAVLMSSSSITFGNDCERLVNIAFQTSQAFPSMMGTCADISQYLRKELAKQYPNEYFHIIIGDKHDFGFSLGDGEFFAEIEQDLYRVLIFSTKQNANIKSDNHDANSQMILQWK